MSTDFVLAPAALADIDEIADFLSAVDPEAASKVIDAIYDGCEFLADRPHLGHARPDLTQHDVFFWGVARRYAIVYRKAMPLQSARGCGPFSRGYLS